MPVAHNSFYDLCVEENVARTWPNETARRRAYKRLGPLTGFLQEEEERAPEEVPSGQTGSPRLSSHKAPPATGASNKAFADWLSHLVFPYSSPVEGTLGKWPRCCTHRHGGPTKRRGSQHCGQRRREAAGVRARGEAPRLERQVQGLGPHAHLVAARGLSGALVRKGPPAGGSVPAPAVVGGLSGSDGRLGGGPYAQSPWGSATRASAMHGQLPQRPLATIKAESYILFQPEAFME